MSDSSSVQLYYSEEDVWGQAIKGSPLAAPALTEFRFTNESLGQQTETAVSEEIRSDRQVSDIIRTSVTASGDAGIELSYGAHDDMLAGGLYDNWSSAVNVSAGSFDFSVDSPNSTGTLTDVSSPNNAFAAAVVGQWLRVRNSGSPDVDGFYKVVAKLGDNAVQVSPAPPTGVVATSMDVYGSFISNGVTRKSFTLEKFFSDIGQYMSFLGMRVGTMDLTIATGSILNGSFSYEGKSAAVAQATIGDGAPVAAPTNDVLNAVDNIADILVDGAALADGCFTSVDFSVDNTLRAQPCIGQLENSGIGIGRTIVDGTMEAYFTDESLIERYLNFTTTSVSFRAVDGNGNSYLFDFPSVKFTDGQVVTGGNDQDVLAALSFSAKRDPVSDFMVAVNRFPATQ